MQHLIQTGRKNFLVFQCSIYETVCSSMSPNAHQCMVYHYVSTPAPLLTANLSSTHIIPCPNLTIFILAHASLNLPNCHRHQMLGIEQEKIFFGQHPRIFVNGSTNVSRALSSFVHIDFLL